MRASLLRAPRCGQTEARRESRPMAQVSWSTAQQLQGVSDAAFAIEAWRRGMKLVAAKNILSGKCHESGKKKHKRKKREGK